MKKGTTILIALFVTLTAFSQEKGFVRGNIADGDFGGPLVGATILVVEKEGVGTTTDFDGNYSLSLNPGEYTLKVSFVSYKTVTFENVKVESGEATIIDYVLMPNSEELEAVEIVSDFRRNSEIAMLMDRKNATNVTDGISSQSFKKVGDSDLSGAMKRVTGVTVQDGKNVFVRGLGDRYTVTTLNNMNIPGLNPDNNSVQLDIFPTSVLENVSVSKTFTPDQYGDFTGGLVNIVTKKFPDTKSTQIGVGLTFIPGMHFNNDFILYNRGKLDWLGFDDGGRALPFNPRTKIPDEVLLDPELEDITRSFSPQLGALSKTALPNGSFSFYHGNQVNKDNGATIGYNMVVNYSNEHIYYDHFESNDYLKNTDKEIDHLTKNITRVGTVGKNLVNWSALASGSYKKGTNLFNVMLLNSQSGESTAAQRINQDFNQNVSTLHEDVLTYTSRTLSSLILSGQHKIKDSELKWSTASSYSRVNDPDFRETRISITDGDTTLSTGNGSGIDRFWRNLNEFNQSARVDYDFSVADKLELKTGASGLVKYRDFDVFSYKHRRNNLSDIQADPNWFLQDDEIWSSNPEDPNYRDGTYTIGNYQPQNSFSARQNIFGAYAMAKHSLFKVVKMVYGLRVEKADMFYTGQNNSGTDSYNDENTLNELNLLPSINLNYGITESISLRAAASRTVARPSFREKSISAIYDPITKRTFIGNLDLEQTNINNYDLRLEYFLSPKEIFSVSGFYKQFDGHIEMVSFAAAPDNITPRNSGDAQLLGAEIELRKSLTNSQERKILNKFFFTANFSLVRSYVDLRSVTVSEDGTTEYDLRELNLRVDEELNNTRPMAGQSPYALNLGLSYEIPDSETNLSVSYNVQGEQLTIIASGRVPDVYTVPFHSLNVNAYRSFGKKGRSRVTLGVFNLLDEDRTLVYKSHGTDDQVYSTFKPGMSFNLKYTFSF